MSDLTAGRARARSAAALRLALVGAIFFLSGFPALVYQLVWQRSLFTIYGINIESVTVVVTGFMLGLGLGSLLGGVLSRLRPLPLLAMFAAIELGIGAFGINSLDLFAAVGAATIHSSPLVLKAAPLLLLLVPTLLMGATLPILVMHLVERSGNVGNAVGLLYFLNTLGSAVACFVVALWMMRVLGMHGAVTLAASFNVTVSIVAGLVWLGERNAPRRQATEGRARDGARPIGFPLTLALGFAVGGLSLSYEIVWFRFFSFLTGTSALAFALILGAFLAGVAGGSFAGSILCRRAPGDHRLQSRVLGVAIVLGSLLGFFYAPAMAAVMDWGAPKPVYLGLMLVLIALVAGLLGAVLPLLSHLGIAADARTGSRLSYLYLANILGSVAGSLGTGFVLMDHLDFAGISTLLGAAGLALGILVLLALPHERRRADLILTAAAASGLLLVPLATPLFAEVWQTLLFKYGSEDQTIADSTERVVETVENKHGIINVTDGGRVFGGGLYDGMIRIDLREDPNGLERPFALSFFHPAPKDVLMIGLATGAWAQVVANHPQLERLTIIEINPGYLELIGRHEEVASLLRNPKVEIVIDDGRRWLVRNPGRKFDAIIQNTTWFFRANTTNLLSEEYVRLSLAHLKEGGIDMYNTTESDRAQRTGCTMSAHGVRLHNQMILANAPLALDRERWRHVLGSYAIDGKPIMVGLAPERLARLAADLEFGPDEAPPAALETCASILARTAERRTMTDDNMGEEWHYLRRHRIFD